LHRSDVQDFEQEEMEETERDTRGG
jgi:hypothetical protein